MNSEADRIAKWYLYQCLDDSSIVTDPDLGGHHWSLFLQDKKVVKNIDSAVADYIHGRRLRSHLSSWYGWTKEVCNEIDWESMAKISKTDTAGDTLWKMKMASGFVPVGKRMLLCKQWTNDKCPRCLSYTEDIPHMLSCNEAGAALTRQRRIKSFR